MCVKHASQLAGLHACHIKTCWVHQWEHEVEMPCCLTDSNHFFMVAMTAGMLPPLGGMRPPGFGGPPPGFGGPPPGMMRGPPPGMMGESRMGDMQATGGRGEMTVLPYAMAVGISRMVCLQVHARGIWRCSLCFVTPHHSYVSCN